MKKNRKISIISLRRDHKDLPVVIVEVKAIIGNKHRKLIKANGFDMWYWMDSGEFAGIDEIINAFYKSDVDYYKV